MGFFKSVRELNQQGKEISRDWDVGAQLADAQASMAAANQRAPQTPLVKVSEVTRPRVRFQQVDL